MKKEIEERLLDLLSDEAIFGLSVEEAAELAELQKKYPEFAQDRSFESSAAGFQLASTDLNEEMPDFIKNRISDQADDFWRETFGAEEELHSDDTESSDEPSRWVIQWLGWVVAGAACIALILNIWSTGIEPKQIAGETPANPQIQKEPTIEERRNALLASAERISSEWESPQEDLNVEGDVVWSDEKQEGYMRFRGLPVNDKSKETYQLWIFDENQKEATPVDGGIFDVSEQGEAIIKIDASLNVKGPKAFAVTVEKPGGVMVSDREKIVALAKVA